MAVLSVVPRRVGHDEGPRGGGGRCQTRPRHLGMFWWLKPGVTIRAEAFAPGGGVGGVTSCRELVFEDVELDRPETTRRRAGRSGLKTIRAALAERAEAAVASPPGGSTGTSGDESPGAQVEYCCLARVIATRPVDACPARVVLKLAYSGSRPQPGRPAPRLGPSLGGLQAPPSTCSSVRLAAMRCLRRSRLDPSFSNSPGASRPPGGHPPPNW